MTLDAWPLERVLALEHHLHALTLLDADAIHVYAEALGRHDLQPPVRRALDAHLESHEENVEALLTLLEDLGLEVIDPRNPSPLARSAAARIRDAATAEDALRGVIAYEAFLREMHHAVPGEDVPSEVTRLLERHAEEEAAHRETLRGLLDGR